MDALPIETIIPDLCRTLERSDCTVLAAPPGSGKTTVAPLRILAQPWFDGKIVMLEPRRLAARAAAARMADLLGEKCGETVGYRVRFDSCVSKKTRIEVVTEGILTRRLQQDPELEGVGLVIFDEFHERSLQADLGLALCWDVKEALRDDLRLLIMSATLNIEQISKLLDAQVVSGEGRSFPVEINYLDRAPEGAIVQVVVAAVVRALKQQEGDILVFFPGVGEIRNAERLLADLSPDGIEICPLYGDLTKAAQDRAIRPSSEGRRRVVLATSIAETSLTIEGVTTVVDSGWSRLPTFDPNSGLTRLVTQRVSRASADQRAGRAGRLGPGVCYRLWTRAEQSRLPPHTPPEIMGADLAPLALELANWGVSDPLMLKWLDAPPKGAYAQASELLRGLDALDGGGRITPTGRQMVGLSLHPRLAHMLNYARSSGQLPMAADLAALLSERDLLKRRRGVLPPTVDIEARMQLLQLWRRERKRLSARGDLDAGACIQIDKAAKQWVRKGRSATGAELEPLSLGGLLSLAFPDRIARRRGSGGYRLAGGRGASLPEADCLLSEEYLVIAALDAGRSEGRIFLAAAITLEEIRTLHLSSITLRVSVTWQADTGAVVAREDECIGELVLSSRRLSKVRSDLQLKALLEGIRRMGLKVLTWSRESEEWLRRLRCLKQWQPEADWPDVSEAALLANLDQWLAPWVEG